MRKVSLGIIFFFVFNVIGYGYYYGQEITQDYVTDDVTPAIHVEGTGEVHVAPDIAYIKFGVEKRGDSLSVAMAECDLVVEKVAAIAKGFGIPVRDIHSTESYAQPNSYYWWWSYDEPKRFRSRKTIEITVHDPEPRKLNAFVVACMEAGVDHILKLDFHVTNLEKYRNEARKLAAENARARAEMLAATLGVEVGMPIDIQEVTAETKPWYYYYHWGRNDNQAFTSQRISRMDNENASDETSGDSMTNRLIIKSQLKIVFKLEK